MEAAVPGQQSVSLLGGMGADEEVRIQTFP
jgi:hypothetical protein